MVRKIILGLVVLLLSAGSVPAQDQYPSDTSRGGFDSIFVAIRRDSAPYYFLNNEGDPSGWLVDLWDLWSQKTGIGVTFAVAELDDTIKLVRDGGADVHAGLHYSRARERYLDFVLPIVKSRNHVFYHKSILNVRSLDDLKAFRIGVIKDSFAAEFFKRELPDASLVVFPDNRHLFDILKHRELRVFAMDTLTARALLAEQGLLADFYYNANQPLETQDVSVAVRKGNRPLAKTIIEGMKKITLEEQAAIERRWIGQAKIKTRDVLVISCMTDYVPFTMLTQTGEPAGLLIDLWRLWAEKTGRKIEFLFGDWSETLDDLAQGRADIHSGLFKNERRELWMNFSSALYPMATAVFFTIDKGPTTLDRLGGKKVGALKASLQEIYIKEKYPGIEVVAFQKVTEMITAAVEGQIEAFLSDEVPTLETVDQMGLSGQLGSSRQRLWVKELNAGISNGRDDLLALVNQGLSAISNREMLELERRWLRDPELRLLANLPRQIVLTEQEQSWLADHETISLGVNPSFSPFEFLGPNGAHEGIASDYVRQIEEVLDINMSPLRNLNWTQVIKKAELGELDVLSCVMRSPERQGYLLFTKPYLRFPLIVVTRDDARLITDIRDLAGSDMAIVEKYAYREYIERDHPDLNLVMVENIEEGLLAVSKGKVEAFADNLASVTFTMRKLGLDNIKVAATTSYQFDLSFGVRKDWPELVPILDKVILSLPERDREEIHNRWVNLRVEQRIDWALVWRIIAVVVAVVGIILAVIVIWNRRLAKEVGQRKKAEERVQYMAANVPGAIFQSFVKKNGQRGYYYMSPRCRDFFGFTVEEAMKNPEVIAVHPDDRDRYETTVREASEDVSDWNFTGRLITPENRVKWFNAIAKPIAVNHDEMVFNGIFLDITERKLAEQEYMAVERKIRAMSQAVHDALVMIDSNNKIAFWNPAAEKMFGFSVYEAVGRELYDLLTPPDRAKPSRETGDQSTPPTGNLVKELNEFVAQRKDGTHVSVERATATFQIEDQWHTVATFRDITERKKAEMQVKKLSKAIEQNPISVIITDREGRIEYVNPTFTQNTGYSFEEAQGQNLRILSSGKQNPEFYKNLWNTILSGETWQGDIINKKKNGEEFWESTFISPITNNEGLITHFVAVKEDITDRKRDEETLLRQLDELERFNKLVVGREMRMIDLKKEINELLDEMGRGWKYKIVG